MSSRRWRSRAASGMRTRVADGCRGRLAKLADVAISGAERRHPAHPGGASGDRAPALPARRAGPLRAESDGRDRSAAMIISRTPVSHLVLRRRAPTIPDWYRKHGGAVLATTIDKYCYITCRYLPPFFEHRYLPRLLEDRVLPDHRGDRPPGGARGAALPRHPARGRDPPRRRHPGAQRHGVQLGVHRRPAPRPVRAEGADGRASTSWPWRACTSSRRC